MDDEFEGFEGFECDFCERIDAQTYEHIVNNNGHIASICEDCLPEAETKECPKGHLCLTTATKCHKDCGHIFSKLK